MSRYIDESIKSFIYDLETEAKSAHDDDPDNEYLEGYFDGLHHAAKELSTAPTVDAVPVKWIQSYVKRLEENGNTFAAVQYEMMIDDYRADGERRTDEQQSKG